jgi:hypothetical protein
VAQFVTRVELHGAVDQDYEALHTAMEAAGFSRTVVGRNGDTYKLPTAEYYCVADTRTEVRDAAKRAAASTNCDYSVLVTEAKSIIWSGLRRITDPGR